MNSENQTVISPEMHKRLKDAGMAGGYEPVPRKLVHMAGRALNGKDVAPMPKRMRYLAKKERMRAGNRRAEDGLRAAKEALAR